MILLLDIGNSRIKWALSVGSALSTTGAAKHEGLGLTAEARTCLLALHEPALIVAASVARGAVTDALENFALSEWGQSIRYVSVERQGHGVICGYHHPQQLGVDRWAALVAARQLVKGPVGVVDAGTAVTLDFMDAAGEHLGGVIFPGPHLMRRSLFVGTDQLSWVNGGAPGVFARDTSNAVFAGTTLAVAAAVDSIRDSMEVKIEGQPAWLLTGGGVTEIAPHLQGHYRHEPALVLEGIGVIARAMAPQS